MSSTIAGPTPLAKNGPGQLIMSMNKTTIVAIHIKILFTKKRMVAAFTWLKAMKELLNTLFTSIIPLKPNSH